MFPLSTVLFPGATLSLHVFETRYRTLMAECLDHDGQFGVVLITRGSEVGGGDERVDVGTSARIVGAEELADGRMLIAAQGVRRVLVDKWLPDDPYPRAQVGYMPAEPGEGGATATAEAEVAVRRLRSLLSELGQVPALPHDLELAGGDEDIGWQLCQLAPLNLIDRQQLLACSGLPTRMELLRELSAAMAEDVTSLLAAGPGE
jgi:Lon protease-like protein